MAKERRKGGWAIAGWITVLTLAMTACNEPTPKPTETEIPTSGPISTEIPTPTAPPEGYSMSPDHLYWEGLVIVTGNVDEIGLVVGTILVNAEPIAVIDLGRIIEGTAMQGGVFGKLQIQLYETGDLTTWEAVERIYENSVALLKEGRIESAVLADPDYVTGYPVTQVEPVQAVPGYELARSVAGDPWGAEGSPWGAEGSPAEGGVVGAVDLFWTQWALGVAEGIQLLDGNGNRPSSMPGGQGVSIAVFDTSPVTSGNHFYNLGSSSLQLEVQLPVRAGDFQPGNAPAHMNEHGLFVAGLAHAVAPESNLQLFRVLNDNAQGDLFWLIAGMREFIEAALQSRAGTGLQGSLERSVMNLSLGISLEADDIPEAVQAQINQLISEGVLPDDILRLLRRTPEGRGPVPSLRALIYVAAQLGSAPVAAAGNDLGEPMQIPAAWEEVLGVGASRMDGTPACYSNVGEVYAPGGDGGELATVNCVPAVHLCPAIGATCPYGVISLVSTPIPPTSGGEEGPWFGYWVGTS